ncbi:MAG: undecaprenyldiphospho-muramoylpentapeptide beta-N-acetylglucosaminyltransferase [Dethiobacteria bacterium]|jgi:UDP-N-acetylglucosamine--N-acetylmuramyl-(pentapeptide) pyrophosphoryl-undecaprenol N-acetylglucosamine transferase|nr:undecaprenyldiphospho-muramoylpentapeptide beta-N-acetylglucosaminyltransferase [Bacillota bacterium]HOP69156.1 undecaprenyldiphospho-muramoylpentapeptide beta-N-acetylglucosaminyltransferase [Bacillota bacterium]HPT33788.1 undecaprenyldiphospho-muramoylpentapeptide beta-N-acetylglucosaminyltransferase [Bacillota bacterium]HQD05493.1 undecaprenyldiphospho-muramoylpentapeptide beta-N-acetylglucosaminyltransferase [Bacillota bacterium]
MRIILSGGGTGGHIYPALALARHILKREEGAELLYVGTAAGLESKIVPEAGIPFVAIPARGYSRRLSQLGPVVKEFASGLARVQSIIRDFRPQAVLGTGGYAAAPVLLASIWRRIPVVLHEQNAIPGAVNRYLAPFASRVCLSFEASRPYFPRRARTVVTGNPRASEVAAVDRSESRRRLKLEADTKLVIAYGGSRGAAKLNQVLVSFIKSGWLPPRVRLIYVTGEIYYKEVREELDPLPGQVQLYPYLKEMPTFLAAADLLISRSGATTLAEITALGLPAILVPSPNVVNNHQHYNASLLAEAGAARLIQESEFNPRRLRRELEDLLREEALSRMAEASKKLGIVDSAERVYRCLQEVLRRDG